MELRDYLLDKYSGGSPFDGEFPVSIDNVVDYCIRVYTKDEGEHATLNQKKEAALNEFGIKRESDREIFTLNKSVSVSRIITDILRAQADREFEMYISALEAATILLEVVRRPIDDDLDDEKWGTALKAKKQGFLDARELIESANDIAEKMLGVKEVDIGEHVEDTAFKGGYAEKFAKNKK